MVRASASQSEDLGFISLVESHKKTSKMVSTASPLCAQQMGIVWRTRPQACLLCPWARHLTGCLRLYVAAFMWQTGGGAKQSTRRGGPSLTEDLLTERER